MPCVCCAVWLQCERIVRETCGSHLRSSVPASECTPSRYPPLPLPLPLLLYMLHMSNVIAAPSASAPDNILLVALVLLRARARKRRTSGWTPSAGRSRSSWLCRSPRSLLSRCAETPPLHRRKRAEEATWPRT
jgi:hypothetical protein